MDYANRLRTAVNRYGYRAILVGVHRSMFQWPRLRSGLAALKLRLLCGAEIGPGVRIGRDLSLNIPAGMLSIGQSTIIGDRCVMEVSANPAGTLAIGANCFLSHDVHIAVSSKVIIGINVRVGEFTSIRDASHTYRDRNTFINRQGDGVGTIEIGDDVWIGKGCLILGCQDGVSIGQGAVIGAHAVVKTSVPDFAIAVGAPAKVIGYRQ